MRPSATVVSAQTWIWTVNGTECRPAAYTSGTRRKCPGTEGLADVD